MFQKTYSALLSGLAGIVVEVECFISGGLPYFSIVGIPAGSALAVRERIRSALKSIGFSFPPSRITVNIRPQSSSEPLSAASYSPLDLPIALSILACTGALPPSALARSLFLGELSLNGDLKPLSGALALAQSCRRSSFSRLLLPAANAAEAALSQHPAVFGITSLSQALSLLCGQITLPPAKPAQPETPPVSSSFDSILGQDIAKRVLMIAAAGMHNLLLIGPPGCGKTLLAGALPSLLPPLTFSQQLQLTEIYSCCRLLPSDQPLMVTRPFRTPHHTIPLSSLIGGGSIPHPGEITLAHQGILYLDELAEFPRASLESLRQPLEDHTISLSRLHGSVSFPADFLLAASMNPCPCGYYPDTQLCHCSASRIRQYMSKIDTPLLDRIDMVLQLFPVDPGELTTPSALPYKTACRKVLLAHQIQQQRFGSDAHYNSRMSLDELNQYCRLSPALTDFIHQAYSHYHLTLRSYHKILKVSRTLADLDQSETIELSHLTEALQYRLNIKEMLA